MGGLALLACRRTSIAEATVAARQGTVMGVLRLGRPLPSARLGSVLRVLALAAAVRAHTLGLL